MTCRSAELPLFGRACPMQRPQQFRDDLRQRQEHVLDWRGAQATHRIYISVAQDPLGDWWASWGWHISADLGQQTGRVGYGGPADMLRAASRSAAIAAAADSLAGDLPRYTGKAGRQVAQLRAALAPLLESAPGRAA